MSTSTSTSTSTSPRTSSPRKTKPLPVEAERYAEAGTRGTLAAGSTPVPRVEADRDARAKGRLSAAAAARLTADLFAELTTPVPPVEPERDTEAGTKRRRSAAAAAAAAELTAALAVELSPVLPVKAERDNRAGTYIAAVDHRSDIRRTAASPGKKLPGEGDPLLVEANCDADVESTAVSLIGAECNAEAGTKGRPSAAAAAESTAASIAERTNTSPAGGDCDSEAGTCIAVGDGRMTTAFPREELLEESPRLLVEAERYANVATKGRLSFAAAAELTAMLTAERTAVPPIRSNCHAEFRTVSSAAERGTIITADVGKNQMMTSFLREEFPGKPLSVEAGTEGQLSTHAAAKLTARWIAKGTTIPPIGTKLDADTRTLNAATDFGTVITADVGDGRMTTAFPGEELPEEGAMTECRGKVKVTDFVEV